MDGRQRTGTMQMVRRLRCSTSIAWRCRGGMQTPLMVRAFLAGRTGPRKSAHVTVNSRALALSAVLLHSEDAG